jgi:glyceraldehyde 3-phosphate dehydrogenase (phosphorylating)
MAIKVGINGFGRIGRNVLRAALKYGNKDLEFVAVNDLADSKMLAHLLKYDSVHGIIEEDVKAVEGGISVAGKTVKVLSERDPSKLPWKELGVQVVLECTGIFTTADKASAHIKAGAKHVIVSAPAKGDGVTTIVMGVNDSVLNESCDILSNASCTTNCLAPVAKVLNDTFGIKRGLVTTIHAYTNDQKILDLPHKDFRRARAAAMSMIPTTTGAAKAVGLVIPELNGKLNGMAIRVPTPDVSVVDLVAELDKTATAEDINAALKKAADGELKGILGYCEEPLVSVDYTGNPLSSIVDAKSTMVLDNNLVKVLSWYDNEWGFSCRMVDLMTLIGKKCNL